MISHQDRRMIRQILFTAKSFEPLHDRELREKAGQCFSPKPDIITVFALVYEAARRCLGLLPFEEQLYGGLVMVRGCIAQMNTGEGKTLTAVFPACYYAFAGMASQIATVNPYLAKRDCEWMRPIYELLGLTVAVNETELSGEEKKQVYRSHIVYSTHSEFGFDYLRDHLVHSLSDKVQPKPGFMLVDEADSILLDEAITPMILSGGSTVQDRKRLQMADHFVRWLKGISVQSIVEEEEYTALDAAYDYIVLEKEKTAILTSLGYQHAEQFFPMYDLNEDIALNHLIFQALQAHGTLHRDIDYIVDGDKLHIVDQNTGRIAEGRRFCDGLWQAIQQKEKLPVVDESITLASISYQQFFRRFPHLCGMTGTAYEERDEFEKVYGTSVKVIPPHQKSRRIDCPDLCADTRSEQLQLIVNEVRNAHSKGQPCLIVTRSVEDSAEMASRIEQAGIPCCLLNAKESEREAEIIAKAGSYAAVTVATALAGRGTDIRPDPEALQAGGLYVIGLGHQNTRRGDRQLIGRSGRQGEVGKSCFVISPEDELLHRFGESEQKPSKNRLPKAERIAQGLCESIGRGQRKSTLELDQLIGLYRERVYRYRDEILEGQARPGDIFLPQSMVQAIRLGNLDEMWPQFLKETELLRQNCSAVSLAGHDYQSEYIHQVADLFSAYVEEMKQKVDRQLHSGIQISTGQKKEVPS